MTSLTVNPVEARVTMAIPHPEKALPHPDYSRPYEEPMPKAFDKPPQADRFEEINTDLFWPLANWVVGGIITAMGVLTLKELLMGPYNWLLALQWVTTAGFGLAMLAMIQKWLLKR